MCRSPPPPLRRVVSQSIAAKEISLVSYRDLWRGDTLLAAALPGVPTGFAELDALLPGGGWPVGAISEILLEREGVGELRLAMPALRRLSRGDRLIAFVAPPHVPYAPALAAQGLELSKLIVVQPQSANEALWAAEQCLRSGACGALLAWPDTSDDRALRRLQLAAEAGKTWGLLYRAARFVAQPSPALLRMLLQSTEDALVLRILKRRGGTVTAPLHLRERALLAGSGRERPSPKLPMG